MSQKTIKNALWAKEVEDRGILHVLVNRCEFHGAITAETASTNTGFSYPTICKHLDKLVSSNKLSKIGDRYFPFYR